MEASGHLFLYNGEYSQPFVDIITKRIATLYKIIKPASILTVVVSWTKQKILSDFDKKQSTTIYKIGQLPDEKFIIFYIVLLSMATILF